MIEDSRRDNIELSLSLPRECHQVQSILILDQTRDLAFSRHGTLICLRLEAKVLQQLRVAPRVVHSIDSLLLHVEQKSVTQVTPKEAAKYKDL